jgi:hypothetical protein
MNDLDVARKELIPAIRQFGGGNKRILADGIYGAANVSNVMSTKNVYDPREIDEFKERVGSRHEAFNSLLKIWKVLGERFTGPLDDHREHMEAVCSIVCFQLDNGSYSLFDTYPIL